MSENNKKYSRASVSAELTKRIGWINGRLVEDYNLIPEVKSSYIKEISLLGRESRELWNKMRSDVKLSGKELYRKIKEKLRDPSLPEWKREIFEDALLKGKQSEKHKKEMHKHIKKLKKRDRLNPIEDLKFLKLIWGIPSQEMIGKKVVDPKKLEEYKNKVDTDMEFHKFYLSRIKKTLENTKKEEEYIHGFLESRRNEYNKDFLEKWLSILEERAKRIPSQIELLKSLQDHLITKIKDKEELEI